MDNKQTLDQALDLTIPQPQIQHTAPDYSHSDPQVPLGPVAPNAFRPQPFSLALNTALQPRIPFMSVLDERALDVIQPTGTISKVNSFLVH
jgi:hypothetical protein